MSTKSKLFAAGNLSDLYKNKVTYFNKRANLIEYVKHYTRDNSYHVHAIGINAAGVTFKAAAIESGKNTGFFWFQCSGQKLTDVQNIMQAPALLYQEN